MLTKERLISDLKDAGLEKGDLLNLKVSLRSIGKLKNGADTLIEALLEVVGNEGTIVSDAFVSTQPLLLASFQKKKLVDKNTNSYAGAFANAMIKHPNSYRSSHPIQKFVAIGALAKRIITSHDHDSFAYGVLEEMIGLKGKNVKIGSEKKVPGVGTTHVAICNLNFEQHRIPRGVYYLVQGKAIKLHKVNWVGGCGFGFGNLTDEFIKANAILFTGQLGEAPLKITDMSSTYAVEMQKLQIDPSVILCKKIDCIDCRLSWSFSDANYLKYILECLKRGAFKKALGAFTHALLAKKLVGQQSGVEV